MTLLHHEAEGGRHAPPLLMGGALGTSLAMWGPQVPALAERHHVIRFDHRGHGRSPEPAGPYAIEAMGRDVLTLMDWIGIERASYCGISLGGMVGQWLAINAPERIERLVLIGTAPHVPPAEAWRERAAAVRAAGTVAAVADAVIGRWLTPEYAARKPSVAGWLKSMVAASPPEGYAACCEAIGAMDLREQLPRIAAPTLVIAGAQDQSVAPAHGEAIAAAVDGARFELLSPMAHLGSVEQATAVTSLILEHLRPTERRR